MDSSRPVYKVNLHKETNEPWLPHRLINVADDPPRVVYSRRERDQEDLDWIPKYAAMSYCWGDSETDSQLKLTSENQRQLQSEIPLSDLSAAQRDAIAVTRSMGLRYLWNDALCIRQGDISDREREAGDMGETYHQYAAFTIVSLMSNFQESFLNPTIQTITIPYRSSIEPSISGNYNLSLDGVENAFGGPILINKLCDTLPSNRWVTRGWAFQEQNHSLRMFFFWPGGLRFNCPCDSKLYCYPQSLRGDDRQK
jgi:Heterokaryon incompatibility protein (HET)